MVMMMVMMMMMAMATRQRLDRRTNHLALKPIFSIKCVSTRPPRYVLQPQQLDGLSFPLTCARMMRVAMQVMCDV